MAEPVHDASNDVIRRLVDNGHGKASLQSIAEFS